MDFKICLKVIIIILMPLSLVFTSACGSKCVKGNSPIMPYFVNPDQEEYKVGDTIWLEARMPHVLKDWETGEYNNYEKVNFRSDFSVHELTDTNIFILGSHAYATRKFKLLKSEGDFISDGEVCYIDYLNKNDSFFLKVGLVPMDTGVFIILLGYNPGGTAHGKPKIDVGDKSCEHRLSTLSQSFNNGHSTLYRAKQLGYKVHYSPAANDYEYWVYDNCMYFFTVKR